MQDRTKAILHIFGTTALAAVALALVGFCTVRGEEHQHPPQDQALHDQFYSRWNMPNLRIDGKRYASCCNNQDCFPTQFKKEGGKWLALSRDKRTWVEVPEEKMEYNYPDAEESPDGQGHACMLGSQVFCAVLGNGV